jgi:glycosyltransferase involved in cell wall biosynthesis
MSLSVTHLIAGSVNGGAARAAIELDDALVGIGINSRIVQSHGRPVNQRAISLEADNLSKFFRFARTVSDRELGRMIRKGGDKRNFSLGLFGASIFRYAAKTDILHLHWINDGGFRLPIFRALSSRTVWTFHDQWPMTGGCHYAFDCTKFSTGCTKDCPALGFTPFSGALNTLKARAINGGVQGVAVSRWLAAEAEKSQLFSGRGVISIPNLVDTNSFWQVPRATARSALGLAPNRRIVLTGHASSSYQKGADLLSGAVRELRSRGVEFDLVGFGGNDSELFNDYSRHFGYVHDSTTLRLLYSAADVFAFPSRTEAFGRTIIEAFACGTPVVAFAGSGPEEIISDGETGVLAAVGDVEGFADGIAFLLEKAGTFAVACRSSAEQTYAKPVVARQYQKLYEKMLARDIQAREF